MFYTKRVDDYKTYRHIMLADQEISKSTPTIYTGLRCITLVMLHLLEFNKENAQQAIDDSWDYYQKKGSEDSFIIRWNLLFCCFQLAFSIGNFKQAALFVDELNAAEFVNSEMKQYKFIARQASLLLHYQNKNEEWVLNQISSVKRLYSGHLKKNVGGNLLLKLLVRLSSTPNKKEKQTLFNRFLVDLNSVFEQYPEHQFLFTFTIIEDWVRATMNGYDTIFDYKN